MRRFNAVRHSPNPLGPPRTPSSDAKLRQRGLILAAMTVLAPCALAAPSGCAAAENDTPPPAVPDSVQAPAPIDDAGAPGDAEAPCTADCEYFPPACSADVLCPNGLFDPAKPAGGPNHFDGRTTIRLVRGRSASDVWVVGSAGATTHFDGTSWVRSELPPAPGAGWGRIPTVQTLWLRTGSEVGIDGIGGGGRIYMRGLADAPDASPGGWTVHYPPMIFSDPNYQQSAQVVTYGWAAPDSEWFWVATRPAQYPEMFNPPGLVRLRLTGPTTFEGDVRAVGAGSFVGMHGTSADDFWAVGMNGASVHVTGASGDSPTVKAYNTQTRNSLYGVWAASESDVWAVGFDGTIRHYAGDPLLWDIVSDVPAGVHLTAVWGTSSSDIWAVGREAVVLHYDGTRWSRMKVGGLGSRRPDLVTVWASDPEHVWIGGEGVVLSLGGKP